MIGVDRDVAVQRVGGRSGERIARPRLTPIPCARNPQKWFAQPRRIIEHVGRPDGIEKAQMNRRRRLD